MPEFIPQPDASLTPVRDEASQSLFEQYAQTEVTVFGMTGTLEELSGMCPVSPEQRSPDAMNRFAAKALQASGVEIPENFSSLLAEPSKQETPKERVETAVAKAPKETAEPSKAASPLEVASPSPSAIRVEAAEAARVSTIVPEEVFIEQLAQSRQTEIVEPEPAVLPERPAELYRVNDYINSPVLVKNEPVYRETQLSTEAPLPRVEKAVKAIPLSMPEMPLPPVDEPVVLKISTPDITLSVRPTPEEEPDAIAAATVASVMAVQSFKEAEPPGEAIVKTSYPGVAIKQNVLHTENLEVPEPELPIVPEQDQDNNIALQPELTVEEAAVLVEDMASPTEAVVSNEEALTQCLPEPVEQRLAAYIETAEPEAIVQLEELQTRLVEAADHLQQIIFDTEADESVVAEAEEELRQCCEALLTQLNFQPEEATVALFAGFLRSNMYAPPVEVEDQNQDIGLDEGTKERKPGLLTFAYGGLQQTIQSLRPQLLSLGRFTVQVSL